MSPKKKQGRPEREITDDNRREVEALAGFGLKQDQIAIVMKISEATLKRRCPQELARGAQVANAAVIKSLYLNAIGGNVAAQIFWAKARAGWCETAKVEVTGKDGGALTIKDLLS